MNTKTPCAKTGISDGTGFNWHACRRRGIVEEQGRWWCRQHAPSAVENRRAASNARYEARLQHLRAPGEEIDRLRAQNKALLEALKETADIADDGQCCWCDRLLHDGGLPTDNHDPECRQARAAIAQVKGEA